MSEVSKFDRNSSEDFGIESFDTRQFSELIEAHSLGMAVISLDGRVLRSNARFCEMFGYSEAELKDLFLIDLGHPADTSSFGPNLGDLFHTDAEPLQIEKRCLRGDGIDLWCKFSVSVTRDEDGTPLNALCLVEDITTLKEIEQKLVVKEQDFNIVTSNVSATIAYLDTDRRFRFANKAYEDMLGLPHDRIIGKHLGEIIGARGYELASPNIDAVLLGNRVSFSGKFETQEGAKRDSLVTMIPDLDSDETVRGFYAIVADITELEQTKARLRAAEVSSRESEDSFRSLLESATDGIVVCDATGKIAIVNAETSRLFGFERDELIDSPVEILVPDAKRGPHTRERQEFQARPVPHQMANRKELSGLRKDGTQFPAEISLTPCRIGGETMTMAMIRDVTDQRELEAQVLHSQKMNSLGLLAGGVAHDFNNVMTVIQGYCSLIEGDLDEASPANEKLARIGAAVNRASTLTRQLLAFSRKQRLDTKLVDLGSIVSELTPSLQRMLGEQVQLRVALKSTWIVRADPAQLEQVVLNLTVNARDAMEDGGILTIEISDSDYAGKEQARADTARYWSESLSVGQYVRMSIRDTGTGMSPETLSRVFEPSFTTKERGKGTGLGLPSVHGIVGQAGGALHVESEEGKGTCFTVYLPRTEGDESAAENGGRSFEQTGSGVILVIEDDENILELVRAILTKGGYTVLHSLDPRDALDRFSDESVDLILTDVMMPEMKGPEFVSAWERQNAKVEVLYMSGYTEEFIGSGPISPDNLIEKPFTPTALLHRVVETLGRRGAKD